MPYARWKWEHTYDVRANRNVFVKLYQEAVCWIEEIQV